MKSIKFSHHYPKLHDQTAACLLAIEIRDRSDLSERFIEYDTVYLRKKSDPDARLGCTGYYPLPPGKYMILVFLGNEFIPFTTVRRWTAEKERYYRGLIGEQLSVEIVPPQEKSGT